MHLQDLVTYASTLPERITDVESWHRHIPFAFALLHMLRPKIYVELGTHKGDSYSAFCQGVMQQNLPTHCYAVDTWRGDIHAGLYENEIFDELSLWHDSRYSSFSSLLRMTFDDALQYFSNASIDLLHIDGLHTYDAVKHDFNTWLPKMSDQGVILFHDTNVRHSNFGVWQLWQELSIQYPSFEFPYGFGLGVLVVGDKPPSMIIEFIKYANNHPVETQNFFHSIGDSIAVIKKDKEINRLQLNLDNIGSQLEHARTVVEQRDNQLEIFQDNIKALQNQLDAGELHFAEQLQKKLKEYQSIAHELNHAKMHLGQYLKQIQLLDQRQQWLLNSKFWRVRNTLMKLLWLGHRQVHPAALSIDLSAVQLPDKPAVNAQPVTIIIPVYRGLEETINCIESVLSSNYQTTARIVVINDDSPDEALANWLTSNAHHFTLLKNETNLGFVGTVNRGMELYPDSDVLLLNSDTVVANDWLDRIQKAAYSASNIGSVTPFSNNATICSYPKFCSDNLLPVGYSPSELDKIFAETNTGNTVDIPTAVGFCMYIRRDCLQQAGLFDIARFRKGYGEENEFCMRSARHGWRHVLATDTFVYHAGGVSFAETQSEHQQHGHRELIKLYPDYDFIIQKHIAEDPAKNYRFAIDAALANKSEKPTVLFINHSRGGGTQRHVDELTDLLQETVNIFLLQPHTSSNNIYSLKSLHQPKLTPLLLDISHSPQLLIDTLNFINIAHIHYHHIIDIDDMILQLPEYLSCTFDLTIHDYYTVCPQITLTEESGLYCGEPQTKGCNDCLKERPTANIIDISSWREKNALFINSAERVFVPSRDTFVRTLRYFPEAKLILAYHEPIPLKTATNIPNLTHSEPMRVLVIGALSKIKGADTLEWCALQARKQRLQIEFHLLGFSYKHLKTYPFSALHIHGEYQDIDLQQRISEINPDIIWFPGNCPETYSYTLSAALMSNKPIIATNIGAFPERLAEREWTWLLDPNLTYDRTMASLLQCRESLLAKTPPLPSIIAQAENSYDYRKSYTEHIQEKKLTTIDVNALLKAWQDSPIPTIRKIRHTTGNHFLDLLLHKGYNNRLCIYLAGKLPYGLKQWLKTTLKKT